MTRIRMGDLARLSDTDLELVGRQSASIGSEAQGVAEILDGLARSIAEERTRRAARRSDAAGPSDAVPRPVSLPGAVEAAPEEVLVDQREAMLRAYELREDVALSPEVREIWAAVVERLAHLRREAKEGLARQRLAGDDEHAYLDSERAAQETARRHDIERSGGPAADADVGPGSGLVPEAGALPGPRPERAPDPDTLPGPGLAGGVGGGGVQLPPGAGRTLPGGATVAPRDLDRQQATPRTRRG